MRGKQNGFTLIELLMVLGVIGILAAIAYPSYQQYVTRTKRADAMAELQNIGQLIESRKLAAGRGGYKNLDPSAFAKRYPASGNVLYNIEIQDLQTGRWTIVATPPSGSLQQKDGVLSLRFDGQKCRKNVCGMGDEWKND